MPKAHRAKRARQNRLNGHSDETVADLLEKIGRLRALDDAESALLERIVRRQSERQRRAGGNQPLAVSWTAEIDALVMAADSANDVARVAHMAGASRNAIYMRRSRLRRACCDA